MGLVAAERTDEQITRLLIRVEFQHVRAQEKFVVLVGEVGGAGGGKAAEHGEHQVHGRVHGLVLDGPGPVQEQVVLVLVELARVEDGLAVEADVVAVGGDADQLAVGDDVELELGAVLEGGEGIGLSQPHRHAVVGGGVHRRQQG